MVHPVGYRATAFTERAETEKRIGLPKIEIEDAREKLKSRFEQIATVSTQSSLPGLITGTLSLASRSDPEGTAPLLCLERAPFFGHPTR